MVFKEFLISVGQEETLMGLNRVGCGQGMARAVLLRGLMWQACVRCSQGGVLGEVQQHEDSFPLDF